FAVQARRDRVGSVVHLRLRGNERLEARRVILVLSGKPMSETFRLSNPLSLPRVSLEQLALAERPSCWVEPGTSNRKYLRRAPMEHLDPDGAGLFANLGSVEISYPPVFAASLVQAQVVGFRTLLKDGEF